MHSLCKRHGLPRWLWVKNLPAVQETRRYGFHPWVGKIPWRRAWQHTPLFLSGELHGQRSLAGYNPWGCKESDTAEGTEHAHTQVFSRHNDEKWKCNCISSARCTNKSVAPLWGPSFKHTPFIFHLQPQKFICYPQLDLGPGLQNKIYNH